MAISQDTTLRREMPRLCADAAGLRGHGWMMLNVMIPFAALDENMCV